MIKLPDLNQSLAPLLQLIQALNDAPDTHALAHKAVAGAQSHFGASAGALWVQAKQQITCVYADQLDPSAIQPQLDQAISTGKPVFSTAERAEKAPQQALAILPLCAEQTLHGALAVVTAAPLAGSEREAADLLAAFLGARLQGLLARQQAEQVQIELAASSDGWHEFIGHAVHEIKNPLASVKGYADLLLRRTTNAPGDPFHKGLTIISQQSGRATDLLTSLSDTARIDSAHLKLDLRTLDLASLVRHAAEQHSKAGKHTIAVQTGDGPLYARFDEARIRQVLDAMLGNAIKFSPEAGPIAVVLEHSAGAGRPEAIIKVIDHGIGVPPAEQREVFDRFKRGSNVRGMFSGLGLGLFAARQIVEGHGGRMWLESTYGQGATCFVALPLDATSDDAR